MPKLRQAIDGLLALAMLAGVWFLILTFHSAIQTKKKKTNGGATQDCEVSKTQQYFVAQTDCIPHCQGIHHYRAYKIAKQPFNGGKACTSSTIMQKSDCQVQHGEQCNQKCIPGTPDPNSWSACPDCIPSGQTDTYRTQVVPPKQQGRGNCAPCTLSDVLHVCKCNQGKSVPSCDVQKQNCARTDKPIYESACSNPCGQGKKFVVYGVKQPPKHGGTVCSPLQLAHYTSCTGEPDSMECKHSKQNINKQNAKCQNLSWGPWGRCDQPCDGGWQYRFRTASGDDTCPTVQRQPCNNQCCSIMVSGTT